MDAYNIQNFCEDSSQKENHPASINKKSRHMKNTLKSTYILFLQMRLSHTITILPYWYRIQQRMIVKMIAVMMIISLNTLWNATIGFSEQLQLLTQQLKRNITMKYPRVTIEYMIFQMLLREQLSPLVQKFMLLSMQIQLNKRPIRKDVTNRDSMSTLMMFGLKTPMKQQGSLKRIISMDKRKTTLCSLSIFLNSFSFKKQQKTTREQIMIPKNTALMIIINLVQFSLINIA